MTRNAVILNDTSTRYHHGCARVVRLLLDGLRREDVTVLARSAARNDWERDADFLSALERADLVVINGEGTLHHGAAAGERLLKIADFVPAQGKKLALINAMYDQNPPQWAELLNRFDILSARDSDSAAQMSAAVGRPVDWLPDLSLSAPAEISAQPRSGVIIGDSVRIERRRALARAAHRFSGATYIPTKTLRHPVWHLPVLGSVLKSALYALYNGYPTLRRPRFEMPRDEAEYLRLIAGAELHITGRFHAVCLSLLTRTPFLAVTSTSGKIEKLLTDLGLGTQRVISDTDLLRMDSDPAAHAFSPQELAQIDSALADATQRAAALIRELAS
ncbi:polysaccharide pyruvyl transferase family protein [Thalassovita aquimarina]|uniref:Polysaccharide pyruvyl transferase family protein n=1 Tax=Thalassovita aquimarina TaxID=2785917 RepID=A0ABS5HQM5_9RHOB|nr:polysaccharide pyruvyl transferase family protein [Thalassovita aquimarina]MBR9651245.1 polysaccharide pyruvyl transferase family protein [Thalassovita aquimarina]